MNRLFYKIRQTMTPMQKLMFKINKRVGSPRERILVMTMYLDMKFQGQSPSILMVKRES